MKHQRSYADIEYFGDFFSVYSMIKPEKLYDFTLRSMNRYYFDKLVEYREASGYQAETFYPKI